MTWSSSFENKIRSVFLSSHIFDQLNFRLFRACVRRKWRTNKNRGFITVRGRRFGNSKKFKCAKNGEIDETKCPKIEKFRFANRFGWPSLYRFCAKVYRFDQIGRIKILFGNYRWVTFFAKNRQNLNIS